MDKNITVELTKDGYRMKFTSPLKNKYGLPVFICYGYGETEKDALKDLIKTMSDEDLI